MFETILSCANPQRTIGRNLSLQIFVHNKSTDVLFFACPDWIRLVFSVDPKENCEISPSMLDALPLLEVLESPTCQLSPDFRCGRNERLEKNGVIDFNRVF